MAAANITQSALSASTGEYRIIGGTPLKGTLYVQGAKNASLPMIAGALLAGKGHTILRNVPFLKDVQVQLALAESVGAKITYDQNERVLVVDATSVANHKLSSELTTKSRASILMLPPVLHRLGKVGFDGIGGCSLGLRKLDFHHNGFKRLGAKVEGNYDDIAIEADRLQGNLVYLDVPSQTSTENLMMAGCVASGTTIIENAAVEPEVVDFGNFLTKMGAILHGVGTRTIIIEGVNALKAVEHSVMSDRLDAGAFMMAAAVTRGDVTFVGAELDQMRLLKVKLEQMGATVLASGPIVRVQGPERLKPVNAITWPYPGFSTDFLPDIMTLASVAKGKSYLRENVFENRFTQVEGLRSLGAHITQKADNFAEVEGVETLKGGYLTAPDLRAGMAFVLAGLIADGETVIDNIYQVERGHSDVDIRLRDLGANITRTITSPQGK